MRDWINKTHVGDCRELLREMAADGVRVQTCITSPPYFGLRDYGHADQIGRETTLAGYVEQMVTVFQAVRDVLADDGTLWLNLGDSYAHDGKWGGSSSGKHAAALHGRTGIGRTRKVTGMKSKDLIGVPWRVAFALQADGWYLRSDIIWSKPNCFTESVTDRCTKSHEYLFMLAKAKRYYFDQAAIKEPADPANFRTSDSAARWIPEGQTPHTGFRNGRRYETRNKRTVWTIAPAQFPGAHFATFPRALVEPCILAGYRPSDTVLDPFMGSGTTGQVATDLGRQFVGCELNPKYVVLNEMRRTTIGMPV